MKKRIYLIDYENVNTASALDFERVSEKDSIHLFYTNHVAKIPLDVIQKIKCKFEVQKVVAGKQHVDMHLISYLGYLIGLYGKKRKYIIISKDRDYQSTVDTWTKTLGVKILLVPTIADADKKKEDEAAEVMPKEAKQEESEQTEETPARRQPASRRRTAGTRRTSSRTRQNRPHAETALNKTPDEALPTAQNDKTAEKVKDEVIAVTENISTTPEKAKAETAPASEKANTVPEKAKTEASAVSEKVNTASEKAKPETVAAPEKVNAAPEKAKPETAAASEKVNAAPEKEKNEAAAPTEKADTAPQKAEAASIKAPEAKALPAVTSSEKKLPVKVSREKKLPAVRTSGSEQKKEQAAQKIKVNNDITKALGKMMTPKVLGQYTSQIMKIYGTKEFKMQAYRELIKALGQKKGIEAYGMIKSLL